MKEANSSICIPDGISQVMGLIQQGNKILPGISLNQIHKGITRLQKDLESAENIIKCYIKLGYSQIFF